MSVAFQQATVHIHIHTRRLQRESCFQWSELISRTLIFNLSISMQPSYQMSIWAGEHTTFPAPAGWQYTRSNEKKWIQNKEKEQQGFWIFKFTQVSRSHILIKSLRRLIESVFSVWFVRFFHLLAFAFCFVFWFFMQAYLLLSEETKA